VIWMIERITWEQSDGLGRSGWTGVVGGRRLFSIQQSVTRGVGWQLRTVLPFGLVPEKATGQEADVIKAYAERVLIVFMRSLFSAFVTDDLKASYAKAVEAHVGLYADVDDESVEDNGWRRGPGPLHLADFFADLSGTGILDVLKD
jgi:hypothetical protein